MSGDGGGRVSGAEVGWYAPDSDANSNVEAAAAVVAAAAAAAAAVSDAASAVVGGDEIDEEDEEEDEDDDDDDDDDDTDEGEDMSPRMEMRGPIGDVDDKCDEDASVQMPFHFRTFSKKANGSC
jgi:hypothetical protein